MSRKCGSHPAAGRCLSYADAPSCLAGLVSSETVDLSEQPPVDVPDHSCTVRFQLLHSESHADTAAGGAFTTANPKASHGLLTSSSSSSIGSGSCFLLPPPPLPPPLRPWAAAPLPRLPVVLPSSRARSASSSAARSIASATSCGTAVGLVSHSSAKVLSSSGYKHAPGVKYACTGQCTSILEHVDVS